MYSSHCLVQRFGFGLTYTTFEYSDFRVETPEVPLGGQVRISSRIENVGSRAGSEVVQLYVRDRVGSRTRPVRELKGYRRIDLAPGASATVAFELATEELAFHDGTAWVTEPGDFHVWIGPDATSGSRGDFRLRATD